MLQQILRTSSVRGQSVRVQYVDAGQAGITAQSINEIFNSPTIGALAMNEDGALVIDSMSSMEDIIGKERVAEFQSMIDRIAADNPMKALEIQEKFIDLMQLAIERRRATGALNNLMAPKQQREGYLKRLEEREEIEAKLAKDQDMRNAMNETTTADELKEFEKQNPDMSDAMAQEVQDEITKRDDAEAKHRAEAQKMTPAELQREIDAMQDKTDVDKLRLQTYKDVLKDKKDGKAPAESSEANPTDVPEPQDTAAVNEPEQPISPDEPGEGPAAVDEPGNPTAQEEPGEQAARKEDAEAARKEIENLNDNSLTEENEAKKDQAERSEEVVPFSGATVQLAGSQYRIAGGTQRGKLRVLVNPAGTPIETGGSYIIDGETLRVDNTVWADDTRGKTVTFRLEDNTPDNADPGNVKIVMMIDGKVAGAVKIAQATDGPALSERIYIVDQLRAGNQVTATVQNVEYNNFNNRSRNEHKFEEAKEEDKFFSPINEVADSENFVGLALVRGKVEGGQVVTYFDGGASTELAEIIDKGEIDPSSFQPGMVVAVIKDPTGRYRPAQLSARELSMKVRTELFFLMQTEGPAAQEAIDTILEVMDLRSMQRTQT